MSTPNIDELKHHTYTLFQLLDNPHPGTYAWNYGLAIAIHNLRIKLSEYDVALARSNLDEKKSP